MAKRKTKKKLPWTSMEISRVKLNPEQAVLSCCQMPDKRFSHSGYQCNGFACILTDEAMVST